MASFDENGKYIKTNWKAGDKITATKLNKIEESIEAVNDNDISRHVEADARLDALEAKDVAHDKEFTNIKNTIADNKASAELGDYEINSRMTFLENELNEGIEEVHNVASTVDGKIATAEANMTAQVNQGKADMEAMVAEVEADLEGLHAKDDELSAQLAHIQNIGINVKHFICDDGEYVKGDGIHDDTTGIQRAINECDKVIFPSGEYKIAGTLLVPKGKVLEGFSTGDNKPFLKQSISTKDIIEIKGNDIKIKNLKFGNVVYEGDPERSCIICKYSNCLFEDLDFDVSDDSAIRLSSENDENEKKTTTYNNIVRNCNFYNVTEGSSIELSNSDNALIENCYITGNTVRWGIRNISSSGTRILNTIIENSNAGIMISLNSETQIPSENVDIINCTFKNLKSEGIALYEAKNINIHGCKFVNADKNKWGITINGAVEGDTLFRDGYQEPQYIYIKNNTFDSFQHCIYLKQNMHNLYIENNQFVNLKSCETGVTSLICVLYISFKNLKDIYFSNNIIKMHKDEPVNNKFHRYNANGSQEIEQAFLCFNNFFTAPNHSNYTQNCDNATYSKYFFKANEYYNNVIKS